jgi:predicted aspartyl protease
MNRYAWLVLGLLLLPQAAQAQTAWPEECRLHRVARLPMTLVDDRVTVPVTVNGAAKNFLVDTGGYATSISQANVDAMKLEPHDIVFNRITDAGGKDAKQYVYADSFRLGALEAKKFDLMVDQSTAKGIDGVLSPDLLRNFDVEFDFAAMTMNLFRPHPGDGKAAYWTKDSITMPMDVTKTGHTRVEVTLDGEEMDAILDTGASLSVMPFDAARRFFSLEPDSAGVVQAGHLGGSQGSVIGAYRYSFKSLSMGGVAVSNPRLALADTTNILSDEHVSLVVGMTEMRYLHLYFAYHEQKLYISAVQAQ